jgi:hypothetical protein
MAPAQLLRMLLQAVTAFGRPPHPTPWQRLLPVPRRRGQYLPVPLGDPRRN